MRRTLFPFELHSRVNLEAREGIEPRAFPPSSYRFGLEDRRRERGPHMRGRGVRSEAASSTPRSKAVAVLPGMSHAPMSCAHLAVGVGIEPTFRAFQARANPSQLSDQERPQMNTSLHESEKARVADSCSQAIDPGFLVQDLLM